ncbi:Hypothetical_protein [Hexamita inflata]|uniref:Hypothetical_protein n=1 Tax=Hexamita inflata TaxID=28002 RepID=A0AA86REU2_9EUKA|nr:Hypothetical protein HINF_LOCUS59347 [Hexamita inflata]
MSSIYQGLTFPSFAGRKYRFCWELLGDFWFLCWVITSNKNIKNKNWEIPSKKQTYQTWVDTSNIILFQRNRHISNLKCRACVPNINIVLFFSSAMISMM